jgi:uncharacterized membrane protein
LLRWYCCELSCSYLSTIQNLVSSLGSCMTCQSSVYYQLQPRAPFVLTDLLILSVDTSSFDQFRLELLDTVLPLATLFIWSDELTGLDWRCTTIV